MASSERTSPPCLTNSASRLRCLVRATAMRSSSAYDQNTAWRVTRCPRRANHVQHLHVNMYARRVRETCVCTIYYLLVREQDRRLSCAFGHVWLRHVLCVAGSTALQWYGKQCMCQRLYRALPLHKPGGINSKQCLCRAPDYRRH